MCPVSLLLQAISIKPGPASVALATTSASLNGPELLTAAAMVRPFISYLVERTLELKTVELYSRVVRADDHATARHRVDASSLIYDARSLVKRLPSLARPMI